MLSARKETVGLYLRELKNMPAYESKVDTVDSGELGDGEVRVTAGGNLGFKTWNAEFAVVFNRDGGYHCDIPIAPLCTLGLSYDIREVTGGTVVEHEERYRVPILLMPVLFILKSFIARAMEKKLWAIKEGAEKLERLLYLRNIESQGVRIPSKSEKKD